MYIYVYVYVCAHIYLSRNVLAYICTYVYIRNIGLDATFIDVKIKEAINKAWNWVIRVVFRIKIRESRLLDSYYILF